MASRQLRKTLPAKVQREEESKDEFENMDEEDPEATQDDTLASLALVQVNERLFEAEQKQKEKKRKAVEAAHAKNVKALKAKIDEHFESRKMKVAKLQAVQLDRLADLHKRRRALERHILDSMKSIRTHHVTMAKEIQVTLQGRVDDIQQAEKVV